MHFMIQIFKSIIFAVLISNIITKQNENTTSKNNTHTMKKYDDNEYVDIKNKESDNNIKKNEFEELQNYVVKNIDVLLALIISVLAVCVCMLVLVIMNCSRWENISQCNRECIKRNYFIIRDCCRGDTNLDQPSYHPEHSCEDFCRWWCIYDYFNFSKSNPDPHQPTRVELAQRTQGAQGAQRAQGAQGAQGAQRAQRTQRMERVEVHAKTEPLVVYDGSNVSIQEHHTNFRRSNSNPDHQPEHAECAERVGRVEYAIVRAEVHAEPSIRYDGSNVSIQEHHANFRRSNPNPDHQPEHAERAECAERIQHVERAIVHAEAEPSIIHDESNVPIKKKTVFMETHF